MALVSVITPAWNSEAFIGETIRSVRSQTFQDWEMLVADDCSTDATASVVADIARTDPRVRLLRLPSKGGGPALARQTALRSATGRFVAFLDSDDLWMPRKLELQLNFMMQRRAALSYTAFRRMNADGTVLGALKTVPLSLSYNELLCNTAIACMTAMVDRDVSGPIEIEIQPYEDFVLWLSILKRGHVAYGLNEDLARYRVREGSVSSKRVRSAGWVWHIYRQVEGISIPRAAWCLANFGVRAWAKRREF